MALSLKLNLTDFFLNRCFHLNVLLNVCFLVHFCLFRFSFYCLKRFSFSIKLYRYGLQMDAFVRRVNFQISVGFFCHFYKILFNVVFTFLLCPQQFQLTKMFFISSFSFRETQHKTCSGTARAKQRKLLSAQSEPHPLTNGPKRYGAKHYKTSSAEQFPRRGASNAASDCMHEATKVKNIMKLHAYKVKNIIKYLFMWELK